MRSESNRARARELAAELSARQFNVPNFRDFYPDHEAYTAAVLAWHVRGDAIKAELESLAAER